MTDWRKLPAPAMAEERRKREAKGAEAAAAAPVMASEAWETSAGSQVLRLVPATLRAAAPLVFVHGGGWVFGSPVQSLGLVRRIADQAGRPVLALRYPLAPEHPWPAAPLAVAAVLRAVGPVAGIIGGSAGAQIAVEAMLRLRDEGAPLPARALMFCGAFGMGTQGWTHDAFGLGPGLTSAEMAAFLAAYRGGDGADITRADLTGLPPLWLACGDRDPLLADTLAVFRRAKGAHLAILPGAGHGFMNDWHCDAAIDAAVTAGVAWLA